MLLRMWLSPGWQKVRGGAALAWGSFLWFLVVMVASAVVALCVQTLSVSETSAATQLVSMNTPSLTRSAFAPRQTGYVMAERSETFAERRSNAVVMNSVMKKPDLSDPKLRAKLAKGMGHNYYGEPAWPNDLLYMFPVCILGTIAACFGLATMEPTAIGEPANPFATPLEILPEWYFFPTFKQNLLRVIPNKLLGVLSMAAVPVGLITVPFIENVNKFQNPFRRPVATSVFLLGTVVAIWLGIGATLPIDKAISLGFW